MTTTTSPRVLRVEAASRPELGAAVERLRQQLSSAPPGQPPAGEVVARGETGSALQRLVVVASSNAEAVERLASASRRLSDPGCRRINDPGGVYYFAEPLARTGKVAFLFPGHGVQYPGMLADIERRVPESARFFIPFRATLSKSLYEAGADDRVALADAIWAIFGASLTFFEMLGRLGVRPDMVVGHSFGDHAALAAAGCVRFDGDAEMASFLRAMYDILSEVDANQRDSGMGMLSVVAPRRSLVDRALAAHADRLYLAVDNCDHQVLLAGHADAVAQAARELAKAGAVCERWPEAVAPHTPLLREFAERIDSISAMLDFKAPRIPVYSCATCAPFPPERAAIQELLVRQWTECVRFRETLGAMYDAGARVFVDCGPGGGLAGFVDDTFHGRPHAAITVDAAGDAAGRQWSHAIALLAAHHVPVELGEGLAAPEAEPARPAAEPASAAAASASRAAPPPAPGRASAAGASPAPAPPAGASPARRAAALHAWLATMDRFLALQREVMVAHARSSRRPAAVAAPTPREEPPFVRAVESRDRRSLVARCDLDLREDLFLLDHCFGGRVSALDPELTALPVVPFAMSLEILAETAAALLPHLRVIGLRSVTARRWLLLTQGRLSLRLSAEETAPGEVRCEIRGTDDTPEPLVEGTVLMGRAYPPARAVDPPDLEAALSGSAIEPGRFLEWAPDIQFHGPLFKTMRRLVGLGPSSVEIVLTGTDGKGFFRTLRPALRLDPVALDGFGQSLSFWLNAKYTTGRSTFPFLLGALDLHAPPAGGPGLILSRAQVRDANDLLVRADATLVGPDATPLATVKDWSAYRVEFPPQFRGFWGSPVEQYLSAPADGGTPGARKIEPFDAQFVESMGGVWHRAVRDMVLSARERSTYANWGSSDVERLERLMERIVAKDAVRSVLARRGLSLGAADVDLGEQPSVPGKAAGSWGELALSVTRSGTAFVATASEESRGAN